VSTTEALRNGTSVIADSATHVVEEVADRAKRTASHLADEAAARLSEYREPDDHPKRRRGLLLLGVAASTLAVGWLVKLARRTGFGHRDEEEVIDLSAQA
jgi:hypothetical protein